MATVNLNPNGTVTASWEISAGDTAHDALRTSGSGTYIRSPDQNKYVIVTLDDYSSGGTITSIRYCVSGFMFNARGGVISDVQIQREKQQASDWIRSKDCEFFCDLAGTEQDHIIKLHDVLTYQYNTGKVTLEEVRFAIRKLELKI